MSSKDQDDEYTKKQRKSYQSSADRFLQQLHNNRNQYGSRAISEEEAKYEQINRARDKN